VNAVELDIELSRSVGSRRSTQPRGVVEALQHWQRLGQ
jgi:hypothetical protein